MYRYENNIKLWKKIVGCCLLAVLMYNCADDSYLIDGGKANLIIMEYDAIFGIKTRLF